MRIELAAAVTAAAPSVVRLSLSFGRERAHGTGFLISPDRILTNHHNVHHEKHGPVTGITAEFDYEERFVGDRLVCKGRIDTIVGNPAHDWAVIELVKAVDRPALQLGTPFDVGLDDSVVIIQHPAGAFKKFALEPLGIHAVDGDRIRYLADTQQGSSGSPVFNVQMHVIALHHAESEETVTVEDKEQVVWSNQGIAIHRVMDELKQRGIAFATND
jgi:S1-C subfamily serine protease